MNSKLTKLLGDEFGNVQREMENIPYKIKVRLIHVCNGKYTNQSCINNKHGKPIHVLGLSTTLMVVKYIMNRKHAYYKIFRNLIYDSHKLSKVYYKIGSLDVTWL